jgi:type VI secretion system ImpJ/VasE family protein
VTVQNDVPLSVHWEEGQLLQPHQFQQLQRSVGAAAAFERSALVGYPYGLLSVAWDEPKLQTHQLLITQLNVIMPNGVAVRVPESAVIPELSFKQALARSPSGITVHIGLPKLQPGRPNSYRQTRSGSVSADAHRRRYLVEDFELHDENQAENKATLAGRLLNLSLLTDGDSPDGFDTFPLLRLKTRDRDVTAAPIIDAGFVPASLHLRHKLAGPIQDALAALLRGIAAHVEDVGKNLETGGYDWRNPVADQITQVLRVSTMAKFRTRMLDLLQAPVTHPWAVYLELLGFRAEMSAMDPRLTNFATEYGRSGDELRYAHDDPLRNFERICTDITSWLRSGVEKFTKTVLSSDPFGYLVGAKITPEEHRRGIYLGIATDDSAAVVVDRVLTKELFKVAPRETFDLGAAVDGLPLEHRYQPPRGFPAKCPTHGPITYFQVRGSSNAEKVQKLIRDHMNGPWEMGIYTAEDVGRWEVALYLPEAAAAETRR